MAIREPLELSRDDIIRIIDAVAQRRGGISAKDLLRAYQRGTLEDPGKFADLLVLADLLSPRDPIFDAA